MRGGLATQARKMGMAERKIDRVSEELKSAKQELKNMMELMAGMDSKFLSPVYLEGGQLTTSLSCWLSVLSQVSAALTELEISFLKIFTGFET